jgi:putative alpha-1,2-mannosidase
MGTPMFDKATLKWAGGRTLVISRNGQGIYVQSVSLDGAPYPGSWLPIDKIHPGVNQLRFTMSEKPDKERGTAVQDRPPAFR